MVELRNEGPARVELLDAAGRVLESHDFHFLSQARGAVRFNQAGVLPSGIYWVRVAQGVRSASKRVALLE